MTSAKYHGFYPRICYYIVAIPNYSDKKDFLSDFKRALTEETISYIVLCDQQELLPSACRMMVVKSKFPESLADLNNIFPSVLYNLLPDLANRVYATFVEEGYNIYIANTSRDITYIFDPKFPSLIEPYGSLFKLVSYKASNSVGYSYWKAEETESGRDVYDGDMLWRQLQLILWGSALEEQRNKLQITLLKLQDLLEHHGQAITALKPLLDPKLQVLFEELAALSDEQAKADKAWEKYEKDNYSVEVDS